jgi:hypothetical protein
VFGRSSRQKPGERIYGENNPKWNGISPKMPLEILTDFKGYLASLKIQELGEVQKQQQHYRSSSRGHHYVILIIYHIQSTKRTDKKGQSIMWYNPSKVGEPHTVTFALDNKTKPDLDRSSTK